MVNTCSAITLPTNRTSMRICMQVDMYEIKVFTKLAVHGINFERFYQGFPITILPKMLKFLLHLFGNSIT